MNKLSKNRRVFGATFLFAVAALALSASQSLAQSNEREQGVAAQTLLSEASELFNKQKLKASAKKVAEAEAILTPLSTSKTKATRVAAKKLLVKIRKAKQLLTSNGVPIPKVAAPPAAAIIKSPGKGANASSQEGSDTKNAMAAEGTVSFAKEIAPVLIENCLGCHGERRQRADLSMASFDAIEKGGNSGTLRRPAAPVLENLLIKKLRGLGDGEQMPLGEDPLPEETIKLIEAWLAAGAGFDGDDPAAPLADVVATFINKSLTGEQLFARREKSDQEKWSLAFPNVKTQTAKTTNFRLVASADSASLDAVAKNLEERLPKIIQELGLPKDANVKGGLSVFVVGRRFDYAEFCQMVEHRELPPGVTGHWQRSPIAPHILAMRPSNDEGDVQLQIRLNAQLASFLTSEFLSSRDNPLPEWFVVGTGHAIASRLAGKSNVTRGWTEKGKEILRGGFEPDEFFRGNLPPNESAPVSYVLASRLMGSPKRFRQLSNILQNGRPFEDAFKQVYRGSPMEVLASLARGREVK